MGPRLIPPHSAPLSSSLGGRGMAGVTSSAAPATPEQQRREGLRRMHERLAAPRAIPDLPKYADLRDGGLMPREPWDRSAVLFWLLILAGGVAFWALLLPKIIRAFAHLIVIGANFPH